VGTSTLDPLLKISPKQGKLRTAHTSHMALARLYEEGKLSPARQAIIHVLKEYGKPMTRAEISHYTYMDGSIKHYPINSVCGRVYELLEAQILIEEGTKKCSITGQTSNLLRLAR